MAIDEENSFLYIADTGHHRVVQINMVTGTAATVAGSGNCVAGDIGDDRSALAASLCSPTWLGLDDSKNLLVVDSGHEKIRRVIFNRPTTGVVAYSSDNGDLSNLKRNSDGTWERRLRSGTISFFNSSGKQTSVTDRVNRSTLFTYDGDGNLTTITDPVGQTITYNYAGDLLSSITDPSGKTSSFSYSGNELRSVQFPDSSSKYFTYNNGLLIEEKNQRNFITRFEYNKWSRIEKVIPPNGLPFQVNDFASGSVVNDFTSGVVGTVKSIQAGHNQTYDGIINPKGVETKLVPNFDGFVTEVIDGKNQSTLIKRDLQGRPLKVERPDGTHADFVYDPATHDLISNSDSASGSSRTYEIDSFGNLTKEITNTGLSIIRKFDDTTGQLNSQTAPNGFKITSSYNALGLRTSVVSQTGASTTVSSNSEYDALGRVKRITDSSSLDLHFAYDASGNIIKKTEVRSVGTSLVTVYTYDIFNRLTSVISPKGEATSYAYLTTGELEKITDPKGQIVIFSYDEMSRLVRKTDTRGKVWQFNYDAVGNLAQEIDPNSNLKSYEYDAIDKLTKKILPDDLYQYAYDIRGNLIFASNKNSQVSFGVDSAGRVQSTSVVGVGAIDLPQVGINYSYNSNNQRIAMGDSLGGATNYSYSVTGEMVGLTNSFGENFGFSYDGQNRLTQSTRPGGLSTYSYGTSNYLQSISHEASGQIKSTLGYTRDGLGQVSTMTTTLGNYAYVYDSNNFLSQASSSMSTTETFTYDSLGNRITDQNGNYVYDGTGQLLLEDYKYNYQYDNNGNMTFKFSKFSSETVKFSYSSENQLVGVDYLPNFSASASKSVKYAYDALGRRLEKNVIDNTSPADIEKTFTRRYVYDNQENLLELDGTNQLLARYTHSGLATDDVLAVNVTASGVGQKLASSAGSYFYLKDHLGSIRDVADAAGNVIQRYVYSAYGTILEIKDGTGNNITSSPLVATGYAFTGREFDKETGLYYYRARYYDSNIGRFLQQDPHPGRMISPTTVVNKYGYAKNSPANFIDPQGRFPWLAIFIVAAVVSGIEAAFEGGNFFENWAENFVVDFVVIAVLTYFGVFAFEGALGSSLTVFSGSALIFSGVAKLNNTSPFNIKVSLYSQIFAGIIRRTPWPDPEPPTPNAIEGVTSVSW
ncbi:MAG: RHS repeat-associated core domain-containing protein [Pseudomonadota bacterium]|nr:RHS repeat-associated core domain-containing protein [Pseudomonadota bacterium]